MLNKFPRNLVSGQHHHLQFGLALSTRDLPNSYARHLPSLKLTVNDAFSSLEDSTENFSLLSSLGEAALPALSISAAILLLFWNELRMDQRGFHVTTTVMEDLKKHRREKQRTLDYLFLPMMVIIGAVVVVFSKKLPWTSEFWRDGPSAKLLGYSCRFYASYITLDTCTDECKPTKPRLTIATSMMLCLVLIVTLTTKVGQGGHLIFTLKAIELLIGTSLAGTVDTIQWKVLFAVGSGLIGVAAFVGWLPMVPVGASLVGVSAYATVSVLGALLYQILQQKSSATNAAKSRVYRSGFNALAVLWGLPPGWALYDAFYVIVFFFLKIVVDTVGIAACEARLSCNKLEGGRGETIVPSRQCQRIDTRS